MPALLEAQQGLDTLKAADITEMRSFANPVDTLRFIGYCMLIYLGHSSITWKDVIVFFYFIPNCHTGRQNQKGFWKANLLTDHDCWDPVGFILLGS